jgi:hypothetical protein
MCCFFIEHNNYTPLPEVQYLEIVTPAANETCDVLPQAHKVIFSEPIAELGNARKAILRIGDA